MRTSVTLGALLVAFAVAGTVEGQENDQAASPRKATAPQYEGWRQYMVVCARCHGDDAVGGVMAPDVRVALTKGMDKAGFTGVVLNGRPDKGMPANRDLLTADQADAIYQYVAARASGSLAAGRPQL